MGQKQDALRALRAAIDTDTARIQQARRQQVTISRGGTALARGLGLGKRTR